MTTTIAELYDALIAAGSPDDKARRAAETVAAHESRFSKLESELAVVKWMVGFNLAATIAILMLLLKH
ncbi:MAG: hypothetical protein WCJ64_23255 [Rhodospirillaceae bacterium]